MTIATLLVFALFTVVGLAMCIAVATRKPSSGGGRGDDTSDGGGGSGVRDPDPTRPPGASGEEPPWWPAFERELAEYIAKSYDDRPRERQPDPANTSGDAHAVGVRFGGLVRSVMPHAPLDEPATDRT